MATVKGKIKKEAPDNLAYVAAAIHITHIPEFELHKLGYAIQTVAESTEAPPDSTYTKLAKRFTELLTIAPGEWSIEQVIEVSAIMNMFNHMLRNLELYGPDK
jgi:hypothetical protein